MLNSLGFPGQAKSLPRLFPSVGTLLCIHGGAVSMLSVLKSGPWCPGHLFIHRTRVSLAPVYEPATQDGCSLALCTAPAHPAAASPLPYSPDWPFFFSMSLTSKCLCTCPRPQLLMVLIFTSALSTRWEVINGVIRHTSLLVSLVTPTTGNLPLPQ